MLRAVFCILAASAAFAQPSALGIFSGSTDVGDPPLKGSAEFDATTGEYKITGTGADIWARADQFHYAWREVPGDFSLAATVRFLSAEGNAHRKAVLMLRKSLDTDSPFLHLAIHADGMASVQFRNSKGDTTNTVDFPTGGRGVWTLKLARKGSTVTVWTGKDGAPLVELGHTVTQLGSPVLAGLGVSSHTREATATMSFSNVTIETARK